MQKMQDKNKVILNESQPGKSKLQKMQFKSAKAAEKEIDRFIKLKI